MKKIRIDKLLLELGLAPTQNQAQAMVMTGKVLVNDTPITKAGTPVPEDAAIRIKGSDNPFVSRGGLKLKGALDDFGIDVKNKTILDIGASTGGFTDCCLQRGATQVFTVDVGTNQLVYALRTHPKVLCFEKTNARNITPDLFPAVADMAVIDVSFISITKILAAIIKCLSPNGSVLAMVKPQFELDKDKVPKGGVIRSNEDRVWAVEKVCHFATSLGMTVLGQVDSRLPGPKGNLEIFVWLKKHNNE